MVIKSTPQILKRVSIRWLPDQAYEDTDTIALNVGGYFMDLRVSTADGSLQWSRAGERKTLKDDPLTFQWTRIIDSLGSTAPDEAAFAPLPNGDDLETGTFNKGSGPTPYEEVWRDTTETLDDGGGWAWILQSADGSTFLGKVGGIILGMRQGDRGTESFGVRREVHNPSTGNWEATFESGPMNGVPSAAEILSVQIGPGHAVGDKVQVAGHAYVVRAIATL